MGTPLEAGYSVMGWNHPGFGGSTGTPFPQNDINAIDVVIQFAVERLGFPIESIILFGWSIGGFPSTWAAMQYPDVKGVILDASFDDVLPLAEAKMPPAISKSFPLLMPFFDLLFPLSLRPDRTECYPKLFQFKRFRALKPLQWRRSLHQKNQR